MSLFSFSCRERRVFASSQCYVEKWLFKVWLIEQFSTRHLVLSLPSVLRHLKTSARSMLFRGDWAGRKQPREVIVPLILSRIYKWIQRQIKVHLSKRSTKKKTHREWSFFERLSFKQSWNYTINIQRAQRNDLCVWRTKEAIDSLKQQYEKRRRTYLYLVQKIGFIEEYYSHRNCLWRATEAIHRWVWTVFTLAEGSEWPVASANNE